MENQTMVFWHGGDLSDIDNTFRQQTKKQEYGPGLYLTTSYNVVKDYVKGNRKLYRVEVSLGNSLEDAEIPYEKVIQFLNKLPKSISIKIKSSIDKYNRNGFVNAEIINNLFVNYNLLKPEISYKLKEFYLENDIDYSLVNNAFGWGEDMMILFNTNKIINVERIGPKDKIDKFELHKEGMEISKKDLIQNWLNNPKMLREDAEDANFVDEITKAELEEGKRKKARTKLGKKKKGDRCTRIAKSKYDVWPSAYASGAVVKCRQGKIWKGLKEEDESLDNYPKELIKKAHDAITRVKGKDYAPDVHELQAWIDKNQESLDEKTDFSKEKSKGLHGWFERQGGSGKSKGWVDCNTCRTVDGKKKCKTCGRQEGEKRSKYPACRPTPSACGTKGKGKSWGKKSKLNEEDYSDYNTERSKVTPQLKDYKITPPTDNVFQVAQSNGLTAGKKNTIRQISELNGGVDLRQEKERKRVDKLKEQISSEEGYISRLIVDKQGDVIEGQHRLEALRELGFTEVPVVELLGPHDFISDVIGLKKAIEDAGLKAWDYVNQMVENITEILVDEKGDVSQLAYYEAPKGFEKAWFAAVNFLLKQQSQSSDVLNEEFPIQSLYREKENMEIKKKDIFDEDLVLKRDQSKKAIYVQSDLDTDKARSQETFKNKEALKSAGFKWDGDIKSWKTDDVNFMLAKKTIETINKKEFLIDTLEQLEEIIASSENTPEKEGLMGKIDMYINDLSNATDEAAMSSEIRRYLTFFSKFRGHSLFNTWLIYIQSGGKATKVAGFRQWEAKFYRRVKKGAKGFQIFVPIFTKSTSKDDETGEEITKENAVRFKPGYVFDISQTEPIDERGEVPEEPNWFADLEPTERSIELYKYFIELCEDMGIQISKSGSERGEKGYSAGNKINISSAREGAGEVSTLVHEIAHELMHWKKSSIYFQENTDAKLRELQAESVSYVVLKHYELPTEHHPTYLALWKANKEKIKENVKVITDVAKFIISEIDKIEKRNQKNEVINEQVFKDVKNIFKRFMK